MNMNANVKSDGRDGLFMVGAAAAIAALAVLALSGCAASSEPAASQTRSPSAERAAGQTRLRIGIIGAGKMGGTLGEHWVNAGHEVLLSSRHPEQLKPLAERLGPLARVGAPREAAAFGEVLLVSVPYGALPQVGRDYAEEMKGKVVLETGNPYPSRDGDMAWDARRRGTGIASAEYMPGVRLVRAFNTIPHTVLRREGRYAGGWVAVPLASDDPQALEVAARLVRDAGFEPVVVGPLARAKEFDYGTAVYGRALTAGQLRRGLGLTP
jgi:predicted dinucleotide-binding enzyme